MTPFRLGLCAAIALALTSASVLATAAPQPAPKPAPATAAPAPTVEPAAVQALERMRAYLGTLTTFEIRAETSLDLVMYDGQLVTLDGANRYTVRRPNAFAVEVATPWKVRQLVYDGKSLTLVAPELGYYATVEAPPTIRQTLDAAYDRYGLMVPLQDLFRWADPANRAEREPLSEAMVVGPSKVGGVEADHYAFREGPIDWQIWIQKGEHPVPLKLVILDRGNADRPQFEARLSWNLAPQMTAETFTYRPEKGAMPIKLSTLNSK